MTSAGNGLFYQVILFPKLKESIRRSYRKAAKRGKGEQFLEALRTIHHRLGRDAITFGEPLFHFRALKLTVYQAVVKPVVVIYVVHEEKPLVFLRDVKLLD